MGRGKATKLIIDGIDYRQSRICCFCDKEYFKKILISQKQWDKSIFCSSKCRTDSRVGVLSPRIRRKMTEDEKLKGRKNGRWYGWNKGLKHTELAKIKMSITRQNISEKEWVGFKTKENRLERIKFRNNMQKLVFERDNYTCQMCEKRGGNLQVDHIQSWAEYVELRFSMDNCRTLCMDCHYFVTFGKKKPENLVWGHNFKQVEMRG